MIRKNLTIYYIKNTLYTVVLLFFVGGLTQTFMLEAGIDEQRVARFISLMQIAEVSSMVLLSGYFEKRKDVFRLYGMFHLIVLPMALAMLAVCFVRGMSPGLKYGLMMVCGAVTYMGIGLVGMMDYKIPYHILNMQDYGAVTAVLSILGGAASLAASASITWMTARRDFMTVMGIMLIPVIVMIFACYRMPFGFRETDVNREMLEDTGKKINILTYRPFYLLVLPNFLRGFATGTFTLFTTVAYHLGLIDTITATVMVTIGNVVIFAAGVVYRLLAKYHKDTLILMLTGFLMLVSMPMSFATDNVRVFLVFYALAFFGKTIFEYVSPVSIVPIVDYEVIGQYSACRVALYLLGVALSGLVTIDMVDAMGIIPAMLLNGAFFAFSGTGYYIVVRALLKNKSSSCSQDRS